MLRVVATGGRYAEDIKPGSSGAAAVTVGARTLTESGVSGQWERDQVEVFCIANLITSMFDCSEEFLVLDVHFSVSDRGDRGRSSDVNSKTLPDHRNQPRCMR